MELDKKLMKDIKNGATIWSPIDAKKLRELEKEHPSWITIVTGDDLEYILGVKFDGAKQVPYFGAILTDKGKEALRNMKT